MLPDEAYGVGKGGKQASHSDDGRRGREITEKCQIQSKGGRQHPDEDRDRKDGVDPSGQVQGGDGDGLSEAICSP